MSSAAFVTGFWEVLLTGCLWMKPSVLGRNNLRTNDFAWGRLPFIVDLTQAEMKNCMTIVYKKASLSLYRGKAACKTCSHRLFIGLWLSLCMEKMQCERKYSLIITNVSTLFKVGSLTINKISNLPVTVRQHFTWAQLGRNDNFCFLYSNYFRNIFRIS